MCDAQIQYLYCQIETRDIKLKHLNLITSDVRQQHSHERHS